MGSRFKGEIKKGAMPWHHQYIGNPVLTWILKTKEIREALMKGEINERKRTKRGDKDVA